MPQELEGYKSKVWCIIQQRHDGGGGGGGGDDDDDDDIPYPPASIKVGVFIS
jgi:hypothetical protein